MAWFSWLWIGTPFKFALWLANRVATWTGLFFLWRRWQSRRHAWLWLLLLNAVSFGALALIFFWLRARSAP